MEIQIKKRTYQFNGNHFSFSAKWIEGETIHEFRSQDYLDDGVRRDAAIHQLKIDIERGVPFVELAK